MCHYTILRVKIISSHSRALHHPTIFYCNAFYCNASKHFGEENNRAHGQSSSSDFFCKKMGSKTDDTNEDR